jgi:hypothetical protein
LTQIARAKAVKLGVSGLPWQKKVEIEKSPISPLLVFIPLWWNKNLKKPRKST